MDKGSTQAIGRRGEQIARHYLEKLGLKFVAANWLCKTGEVDLIMQAGSTRVFVEVRMRAPTSYGEGFETVAWEKQRKLIRTAQYYQQKEDWWGDVRFDVVSIVMMEPGPEIEHIEYAFEISE
ncbi:MAG: YraN family protein [bacterium]